MTLYRQKRGTLISTCHMLDGFLEIQDKTRGPKKSDSKLIFSTAISKPFFAIKERRESFVTQLLMSFVFKGIEKARDI